MRRRAFLAASVAALAAPAGAHQLNVFASVAAGVVVVEARFSTGKRPVAGTVRIYDAADGLLAELALGADGTARWPLGPGAEGGLRIEVETGEGHDGYWILTPDDLAHGS